MRQPGITEVAEGREGESREDWKKAEEDMKGWEDRAERAEEEDQVRRWRGMKG